jgi:hypothetical protein
MNRAFRDRSDLISQHAAGTAPMENRWAVEISTNLRPSPHLLANRRRESLTGRCDIDIKFGRWTGGGAGVSRVISGARTQHGIAIRRYSTPAALRRWSGH